MFRLLAIVVCLVVATAASAETIADIANLSGPDRTQRLIDGAKKEGVISLYSSAVTDDSNAIAGAFEKKYGVKVQLWRGSSEDILRRAVTEHRGGRDDVDVAETAGTEMEGLRREQLLQEISSPVFADLIPQAVAPHRPWVTSRLSIFTAAFNTTLIQPEDAPKSYEDLTDPQWKGKLGVEADDANWFMSIAGAMGEDKAVALFRKIVARQRHVDAQGPHAVVKPRRRRRSAAGADGLRLSHQRIESQRLRRSTAPCCRRRWRCRPASRCSRTRRILTRRRCSWISSSATASASSPNAATCRPIAP